MNVSFPGMNQAGGHRALSGNAPATRSYSSFAQMEQKLIAYGQEQTKVYDKQFSGMENNGKISVDELKETIKKDFPIYTMVSSEPADVVDGRHLLYIDANNLQKMADDPDYRAKVFGLMRREGDSSMGTTHIRLNGERHSFRTTGSVFSLSDANESVGGIPYKGSARSMSMSSSAMSSSTSQSIGKDQEWYERLLEKAKQRREERADRLEALQKQPTEGDPIDFYL